MNSVAQFNNTLTCTLTLASTLTKKAEKEKAEE